MLPENFNPTPEEQAWTEARVAWRVKEHLVCEEGITYESLRTIFEQNGITADEYSEGLDRIIARHTLGHSAASNTKS